MTKSGKKAAGMRNHAMSERMKTFAAASLAQKIGYLAAGEVAGPDFFEGLPARDYKAGKPIPVRDVLLVVRRGSVEIHHEGYGRLVKVMGEGTLFGDLPLIGQSLLGTKAKAGEAGASVSIMDAAAAAELIRRDPLRMVKLIGPRLADVEAAHFKTRFQLADSRVADALLELAGDGTEVVGLSHRALGLKLGLYRETVTSVLSIMKSGGLISVGRRRVTLLDKPGLQRLRDL